MKKVLFIIALLLFAGLALGSRSTQGVVARKKTASGPKCIGFTVIEAGKGVDCHGDTIRLVKVNGFYSAARPREQTALVSGR